MEAAAGTDSHQLPYQGATCCRACTHAVYTFFYAVCYMHVGPYGSTVLRHGRMHTGTGLRLPQTPPQMFCVSIWVECKCTFNDAASETPTSLAMGTSPLAA
jgi:hypothetical protein